MRLPDHTLAVELDRIHVLAGCGAVPHAPAAVRAPDEQPGPGYRGPAADGHLVPPGGSHRSPRPGEDQSYPASEFCTKEQHAGLSQFDAGSL